MHIPDTPVQKDHYYITGYGREEYPDDPQHTAAAYMLHVTCNTSSQNAR